MNPAFSNNDLVEIVLPRPFDHGFDYRVPDGMTLQPGDYVTVPFGRKDMQGVVWGAARGEVAREKCRPVKAHHEHIPPMPDRLRGMIDWTADYYMADKGMVLKMAIPVLKALTHPVSEVIYQRIEHPAARVTAAREKVLALFIEKQVEQLPRDQLLEVTGSQVLQGMVKAGILLKSTQTRRTAPPVYVMGPKPVLNSEQADAAAQLCREVDGGFSTSLLHGVTGSGKTEVYFEMIEKILRHKEGQVLVLLPEIALTVQWLKRFEARFGQPPLLWHSSVSEAKRKNTWQQIATGTGRLVVGARSALYLPYADLRAIIVDEEHEQSYKQDDGVLYHARDMAVMRAKKEDIPVVLASATPSLETLANVQAGKYHRLELTERFSRFDFPAIDIIDMKQTPPERGQWLSSTLLKQMKETLAQGHQSLLFLNRRGYAPLVLCRACGHRFECPRCSAWLVMHQKSKRLQCHHCGYHQPILPRCTACGAEDSLTPCGPGVERLEEEVRGYFPSARIATISSDDKQVDEAIARMIDHEVDIVIGTQLLAKGHHFPRLALVGVVDADLGLNGGDLRAVERTYQLLHQLAGRAGREEVKGHVYLQSYVPDHLVMQALKTHDQDRLVELELASRQKAMWPPYGRLAALLFDGPEEQKVKAVAQMVAQAAPHDKRVRLLGPAPAPLSKLRDQYRYRLLVKAPREIHLQSWIHGWLTPLSIPSGVRLKVDIDPYHFL